MFRLLTDPDQNPAYTDRTRRQNTTNYTERITEQATNSVTVKNNRPKTS